MRSSSSGATPTTPVFTLTVGCDRYAPAYLATRLGAGRRLHREGPRGDSRFSGLSDTLKRCGLKNRWGGNAQTLCQDGRKCPGTRRHSGSIRWPGCPSESRRPRRGAAVSKTGGVETHRHSARTVGNAQEPGGTAGQSGGRAVLRSLGVLAAALRSQKPVGWKRTDTLPGR